MKRRIFSVQQNNHNGHIYIRVMQHIPILICFFLEKIAIKPLFSTRTYSTVKSDQKIRFSETISFKRFLNVILVLKVSLTNSEFFQKF